MNKTTGIRLSYLIPADVSSSIWEKIKMKYISIKYDYNDL